MKKLVITVLFMSYILIGCTEKEKNYDYPNNIIYYELFVRSSFDSDGDGIGDFKGIEENISYFTDLGIEGIWFMPINKSDSYHGYDIIDYYDVHSDYGTKEEFASLVKSLNDNNIRVMMDLVINHTSSSHPWFIQSKDINSKYRNYYIYNGSSAYNYFGDSMPDLNLGNQEVYNEIINIGKYYIDLGVSGFRLDAAKHFFQIEENSDVFNTATAVKKSNDFIRSISDEFKKYNKDFYIVSEVLDSNLLSSQFFKGSDSAFNFDIREKLIDTSAGLGVNSYTNVLYNSYQLISDYNRDFIDSPFATNHDLNRIAYNLNKNSIYYDRQLKMIADMLLVLPGSPFIYYGDELGQDGFRQEGVNLEGYGIVWDEYRRLPLKIGNEYETSWINTDIDNSINSYILQKEDDNSLYNHYKNMISIRKNNIGLKYGNDFKKTNLDNSQVACFIRSFDNQNLLIIHNVSVKTLDISYLNLSNIIYKTNDTTNKTVDSYSTIIFQISNEEMELFTCS